ncbi:MAG: PQQ-binding-like beta-propeller repeat protein [Gemmatimonadetes bacterium]|nr:PQQ-binding-like beta-propeller repeat protein [Gemmatimonadota bacterium]
MARILGALFALLVVAAVPASAQEFSPRALADFPRGGWLTNGGNLANQRYSPLWQINKENVGELKGVWQARLRGSGVGPQYSGEAQPLVHDGVIYIVTGANDVFALSVESGEILWEYEANLEPSISTICCGWTSRGVALGEGLVYVGQLDGRLVALDQETGQMVWSTQAERWQEGYVITSAPLYYDGLVITGFAGAEYAQRGRVKAFRASDGELLWTFYTVPGPGEPGHESWPQNSDIYLYGGGSVWQTPAADPELGLIYFATGNAGPDFNGAVRPGDNLFTSSIVALDAMTGSYRWHYQVVHHDIWDYDLPTPVVLFDIEIDDRTRKGLAGTGKTGWVYLLDRETGEPLIGIEERPVPQEPAQATAATQPYPIGDAYLPQSIDIPPEGYDLVNGGRIFTPFLDVGIVMKPSQLGGANWPPSSYDPVTGLYYVCAADRIGLFVGGPSFDADPVGGEVFHGGRFGGVRLPTQGVFAAVDVRTNRVAWSQRWAESCYSGSVTTAGGLIFVGRNDGRLTALDSFTGHRLWEFQTGAGANAPVSVFEYEGTQYVVFYAAGNLFAGSARGDRVWLFSLEGELGPELSSAQREAALAAAAVEAESGESIVVAGGDVELGGTLYVASCEQCHGTEGEGGHNGIGFRSTLTLERIYATVMSGRNDMPSFAEDFSTDQVRALAAYVLRLIGG